MSNFDTLTEVFTPDASDEFLIRQGVLDGVLSKAVLYGNLHPVGTLLSMKEVGDTPSSRGLPGDWEIIEADVAFQTAPLGSGVLGDITGSNTVDTPLLVHLHTATTGDAGAHNHSFTLHSPTGTERVYGGADETAYIWGDSTLINPSTNPDHTHTVTLSEEGDGVNPQIDKRARRIGFLTWERVA